MSGRHTRAGTARRRRFSLVLAGATVLGLWFGIEAPDVSPVAAPVPIAAPAVQVAPAPVAPAAPVVPVPDGRAGRGGGR